MHLALHPRNAAAKFLEQCGRSATARAWSCALERETNRFSVWPNTGATTRSECSPAYGDYAVKTVSTRPRVETRKVR